MENGIKKTGIASWEELQSSPGVPDAAWMEKGPVAYIECVQKIPCNPCETACPRRAIVVGTPIINLPQLHAEKCNGCGACIAACPGLAIFRVHKNYSDRTASIEFPFEYYPLPTKGEVVQCVNRAGKIVTEGKVIRIRNLQNYDHTVLITVEIPKEHFLEVRSIKKISEKNQSL